MQDQRARHLIAFASVVIRLAQQNLAKHRLQQLRKAAQKLEQVVFVNVDLVIHVIPILEHLLSSQHAIRLIVFAFTIFMNDALMDS